MTTDRDVALMTDPHWTDQRFRDEQTVFGEANAELRYEYSDRMAQWDRERCIAAFDAAMASGKTPSSAAFYDAYLSEYFGKPTRVEHIVAGVNRWNGYSYRVYGYRFTDETEGDDAS